MPLLDHDAQRDLLELAHLHGVCGECGARTAQDYCRSCDEFYWLHRKGCAMYTDKHFGHRLTIVPFVEKHRRLAPDGDQMLHREWLIEKRAEEAVHKVYQLTFADDLTHEESRLIWMLVIQKLIESVVMERRAEVTSQWLGLHDG